VSSRSEFGAIRVRATGAVGSGLFGLIACRMCIPDVSNVSLFFCVKAGSIAFQVERGGSMSGSLLVTSGDIIIAGCTLYGVMLANISDIHHGSETTPRRTQCAAIPVTVPGPAHPDSGPNGSDPRRQR